MSKKDKNNDIEKTTDESFNESLNEQIRNDEADVFSRDITKMQAPDEWPDPPQENDSSKKD